MAAFEETIKRYQATIDQALETAFSPEGRYQAVVYDFNA